MKSMPQHQWNVWQQGEEQREKKRNLLSSGRRIRHVSIASTVSETFFTGFRLSADSHQQRSFRDNHKNLFTDSRRLSADSHLEVIPLACRQWDQNRRETAYKHPVKQTDRRGLRLASCSCTNSANPDCFQPGSADCRPECKSLSSGGSGISDD